MDLAETTVGDFGRWMLVKGADRVNVLAGRREIFGDLDYAPRGIPFPRSFAVFSPLGDNRSGGEIELPRRCPLSSVERG